MDKIYQQMWANAFPKVKKGIINIDEQIDNPADNRRGITLLIRPSSSIVNNFQQFLEQTKVVAPHQYYYPATDLHLTALSIFSGQANFSLNTIALPAYQNLIRQALREFPPFSINFRGITLSQSGIVAKGYIPKDTLNKIRNALRLAFKSTTLPHTIDKRYVLKAAHITLMRFKHPLNSPTLFTDFLEKQQNIPFGTMIVPSLDLVFNDWYMKEKKVTLLERYKLSVGS